MVGRAMSDGASMHRAFEAMFERLFAVFDGARFEQIGRASCRERV